MQLEKNENTAKKKKPTHKLHLFFANAQAKHKKPKEQFLANARPKITNVNQQIAKTKEWKKGLLQKLFV